MITLQDYWMGRDKGVPARADAPDRKNAAMTVQLANMLLLKFGEGRKVNSGWRPPAVNVATPNAAMNSKHTPAKISTADPDGDLDEWLMTAEGQAALVEIGLWMEHPAATKSWTHLQTVPPKSGRRVLP